jgi:two-component system chemotaxis response regulator CheY
MGSVLLVDDDADSRDLVARFLSKAGYSVRAAENGRFALVAVATAMPDVIVLDFQMPEMNGIEFLKVIRSYLRWSSVPVILLTAYDKGSHIDMARELGVNHVFLKASFQLADLLACVRRLQSDPESSCGTAS